MKSLSMPFQVGWDIVHLCNFRCKHCYFSNEQLGDANWLTREQALDFVDHLVEHKVFHLSIAGGEPLLYPYIVEVVERASRGGMLVAMSTNAAKLDSSLANDLSEAGLKSLQISLEGSTAEINDSIRGAGRYAQTMQGIEVALQIGFTVFFAVVLTQQNRRDIFDYLQMAQQLGVRGVKIQTLIDSGLGHANREDIEIPELELRELLKELWEYKARIKGDLEVLLPLIPEAKEIAEAEGEYWNKDSSCLGCQPGLSTIRVNAFGDVRACGGFVNSEPVGNILNRPLKDIWLESQEIARWRNESQVTNGTSNSSCGSICGKGCRSTTAPSFAKTKG